VLREIVAGRIASRVFACRSPAGRVAVAGVHGGPPKTGEELRSGPQILPGSPHDISAEHRIYAKRLDDSVRAMGLVVLRSGFASPKANGICERVIGTIRLDWMIPMSEAHLRSILKAWVTHYNRGRPHSALGPGVPGPPQGSAQVPKCESRHRLAAGTLVLARSVLGGLHHEYSIAAPPATA